MMSADIAIAPGGHDGSYGLQPVQHLGIMHVPTVKDEVHALQRLVYLGRELLARLRYMCI